MKSLQLAFVFLLGIVIAVPCAATGSGSVSAEVDDLLDRADALVQLGVIEKGAGRSFEDAFDLVDAAAERLTDSSFSPDERQALALEIDAIREDLELMVELNEERFYGRFRLTRLVIPTLFSGDESEGPEQLIHPPRLAATEIAARKFTNEIRRFDHPRLVMRSSSADCKYDNVTLRMNLGDERSLPVTRRELVRALSTDEMRDFDGGSNDPELIGRLLDVCDAASLVVLTVEPVTVIDELTEKVVFRGDVFLTGEAVQGSPIGASVVIRSSSFVSYGIVRDRRDQFWPIVGVQMLMLALAMTWAARLRWSLDRPLKPFYRLGIGLVLFIFGRVFVLVALVVMQKAIPDSSALALVAWWWPAILGLLAILGVGLVAWLGQARLTNIIPGARGERAVGSIFALTALGAASVLRGAAAAARWILGIRMSGAVHPGQPRSGAAVRVLGANRPPRSLLVHDRPPVRRSTGGRQPPDGFTWMALGQCGSDGCDRSGRLDTAPLRSGTRHGRTRADAGRGRGRRSGKTVQTAQETLQEVLALRPAILCQAGSAGGVLLAELGALPEEELARPEFQ